CPRSSPPSNRPARSSAIRDACSLIAQIPYRPRSEPYQIGIKNGSIPSRIIAVNIEVLGKYGQDEHSITCKSRQIRDTPEVLVLRWELESLSWCRSVFLTKLLLFVNVCGSGASAFHKTSLSPSRACFAVKHHQASNAQPAQQ